MEFVHDIIRGKWKPVIIWQIHYRERVSLSQLEREIKGINQKMLLEQLKELMEYEIVDKIKYDGYPLRVEYFLTENKGKKFVKALEIMQELGREYKEEFEKSNTQKSG